MRNKRTIVDADPQVLSLSLQTSPPRRPGVEPPSWFQQWASPREHAGRRRLIVRRSGRACEGIS